MTKLQNLVNQMIITGDELMLGDVQHNQTISETFAEVKSNKFNCDIATYVLNNIYNNNHRWYWYNFSKGQLKKLNAIMKAKTKETLQKRIYAFSGLLTNGYYSSLFNRKQIAEWMGFCNKHGLEHGLVKVNRIDEVNKILKRI